MSDFISIPLMVLLLCLAGIACHIVWVLHKIKKHEEEEKPNIHDFCVFLKYRSAVISLGMYIAIPAAFAVAIAYDNIYLRYGMLFIAYLSANFFTNGVNQ